MLDAEGVITWRVVNGIGEPRDLADPGSAGCFKVLPLRRPERYALTGEYEPSAQKWVRDQVERYEATGGREANTLRDTGLPVAIFTTRGAKSGKIRKIALMRVEHDGAYAMVASRAAPPSTRAGTTT